MQMHACTAMPLQLSLAKLAEAVLPQGVLPACSTEQTMIAHECRPGASGRRLWSGGELCGGHASRAKRGADCEAAALPAAREPAVACLLLVLGQGSSQPTQQAHL